MADPLVEFYEGAPADFLPHDILKSRELGCDGLIALDVDDGGVHDHYAVFSNAQILDASLVLYGLTGEILSLSERFNPWLLSLRQKPPIPTPCLAQ